MMVGFMSVGRAPRPVLPTSIVCTVPAPEMLKLMVSRGPKVGVAPISAMMSGSVGGVAELMAWMASRSDTEPSPGVLSSPAVVTVRVTEGVTRSSKSSRRRGTARGRRATPRDDENQRGANQGFMVHQG